MSSESQNPQQPTPEEVDDLTLDKETLKDLEPRSDEQDKVRGGAGVRLNANTLLCNTAAPPTGNTDLL
jgi:hypothetical protein